MTLGYNPPRLSRVSRFYTLSNALLSVCVAVAGFHWNRGSLLRSLCENNDFFSHQHDHPQILAVHDTLAVYKGTETMPENIWPRVSVPFAVFTITEYLNYEIRGEYGREKQKSLNKFLPAKHQKPTPLQEKLLVFQRRASGSAFLGTPGRWTGRPGSQSIGGAYQSEQAKRFRMEAVVAELTREDRRKQGLHLTRKAFLQRLRTFDSANNFPASSSRNLRAQGTLSAETPSNR